MPRNRCHEMAKRIDEFVKWFDENGKDAPQKYRMELASALEALQKAMEPSLKALVTYNGSDREFRWDAPCGNGANAGSFTVGTDCGNAR